MEEIKKEAIEMEEIGTDTMEAINGGTGVYKDGKPRTVKHTVVAGNTLSGLANRYNTTVNSIMKANTFIKDKNLIVKGWVLTIHANDKK